MTTAGTTWHELFDQVCRSAGHPGNSGLAAEFCRLTGRNSEADHRTAVRNFANWRQGRHLPSRAALGTLEVLLQIEADPLLQDRWRTLYEAGRSSGAQNAGLSEAEQATRPAAALSRRMTWPIATTAGLLLAVVSFGAWQAVFGGHVLSVTEEQAGTVEGFVTYRERIVLDPGMSAVVHGARGVPCGSEPPEWPEVLTNLPTLRVGAWSDGGTGFRVSKSCAGVVPVRAVVLTATRKGRDDVLLFGDPLTVMVND